MMRILGILCGVLVAAGGMAVLAAEYDMGSGRTGGGMGATSAPAGTVTLEGVVGDLHCYLGAGSAKALAEINWKEKMHQDEVSAGIPPILIVSSTGAAGAGAGSITGTSGLLSGTSAGAGVGSISGTPGAFSGTSALSSTSGLLSGAGMGAAGTGMGMSGTDMHRHMGMGAMTHVYIIVFDNADKGSKSAFDEVKTMVGQDVRLTGKVMSHDGVQAVEVTKVAKAGAAAGGGAGSITGTGGMFTSTGGYMSGTSSGYFTGSNQ